MDELIKPLDPMRKALDTMDAAAILPQVTQRLHDAKDGCDDTDGSCAPAKHVAQAKRMLGMTY